MKLVKPGQAAEIGDFSLSGEVAITRQVLAAIEGKQGISVLETEFGKYGQAQFFEAVWKEVEPPDRQGQQAAGRHPPRQVFEPRLARPAPRQVVEHPKKCDQVERLMGQLRRQSVESELEEGTGRRGQGGARHVEQGRTAVKTQVVPRQQPLAFEETGETTVAATDVEATFPGFLVDQGRQEFLPPCPRMGAGGRKTVGSFVVKTPIEIQQRLPGRFVHGL